MTENEFGVGFSYGCSNGIGMHRWVLGRWNQVMNFSRVFYGCLGVLINCILALA